MPKQVIYLVTETGDFIDTESGLDIIVFESFPGLGVVVTPAGPFATASRVAGPFATATPSGPVATAIPASPSATATPNGPTAVVTSF